MFPETERPKISLKALYAASQPATMADTANLSGDLPDSLDVNQALHLSTLFKHGASMPGLTANPVPTRFGKQIKPRSLPIAGRISQDYGAPVNYEKTGFHGGVDIAVPIGTPIPEKVGGVVVDARNDSVGYGMTIAVKGADGVVRRYSHLSRFNVAPGQQVAPGTILGLTGNTGHSTGPHLDYREYLD